MSNQSAGGQFSNVGTPPQTSTLPQNPSPTVFQGFTGLNTKAAKQGIQDQEMSICDGFMPLGPNNLRCLYDVGDTIYTASGILTIKAMWFGNLGTSSSTTRICIICLSDGSLIQLNTDSLATTTIGAAGTITTFNPYFSQWGALYSIIVSSQTNGYFLWDGSSLFKAGTIGPIVTIINGGKNYATPPTITMNSIGANASGYIEFAGNPSPGNTITLNGVVWTFVASGATGHQTNIGGTIGFTLFTLSANVNASTTPALAVASYDWTSIPANRFLITYDTTGTAGNAYTLAASVATPSGANLSGGIDGGANVTLTGTVANGSLTGVTVTNPGNGWQLGDIPIITITGGSSDSSASATPVVSTASGVASVVVNNGGSGYSSLVQISATSAGSTAGATFSVVGANGVITQVIVQNPGTGYTSLPTLTVTDLATGAVGSGAILTAVLEAGQIGSVTVNTSGSGYTSPPTVTIVGDGIGAQVIANLSGSTVGTVTVVNPGVGYTKAGAQFNGGNNAAAAVASLMPFGVQGNTVETYQSRVWVGNGRVGQYSAPSDPGDFSAINGGGAFASTDSFLRYGYTKFFQSNGFLYLFGDSSINYISGVSTAGNPAITTFNNLNVDPQIGTPWPDTVQAFGRNIVFANPIGVYVSYGGAVTKVSDALDGIYTSVNSALWPSGFTPSAAVQTIFGIQTYILLMPILDQVTGLQATKCLMWDGKKWWTSPQTGLNNAIAASQEVSSILAAFCSPTKTTIKPMFNAPTKASTMTKYVYSKLWDNPGVFMTKMMRELFALVNANSSSIATQATGYITFAGNPAPGATITLNGVVWTFVASGATGNQTNIGGTIGLTLNSLSADLNASVVAALSVATYDWTSVPANRLLITYDTAGTAGNAYTLAASVATPSGATLTGGTDAESIALAAVTENGIGTEKTFTLSALGPTIIGPLPVADQGRLMGVRLKTTSQDMQVNVITLFNQLMQSNF